MGQHAFGGGTPRLASTAQIKDESRITGDQPAKARGRYAVNAQMAFDDR
jgi:hypothetical protein